jgi:hypothetical protein
MLNEVILNRDKKLASLYRTASYLGRSLRENVELFKYDDNTEKVWFVTQNQKIISGIVTESGLEELEVNEASTYLDSQEFNKLIEKQVNSLIGNLYRDNYSSGKKDLVETLNLWEERLKLNKISKLLQSKSASVVENKDILSTPQFKNLMEILPSLTQFLKVNKTKISNISEIRSTAILSKTIAEAFNMPKVTYQTLAEAKKFEISESDENVSLYELITRQELIKKELLENKRNFNLIWTSHPKVIALANAINGDEDEKAEALSEAITDIPYVALLSKKQMTDMFNTLLNVSESVVNIKDIQSYSSQLFEAKKPIKRELIKTLDEKYGINFQNLKEPASFRSLLNTQIVLFETLNKVLPKGSAQKQVIKEAIEVLKEKNGIEAIDVNDIICTLFEESGYSFINESAISRYLDFDSIANDLGNVVNILKMIKSTQALGGQGGDAMPQGMQSPQPTPNSPVPQDGYSRLANDLNLDVSDDTQEDDEENVEMSPEDEEGGDMGGMGGLDRDGDGQHTMQDHELEDMEGMEGEEEEEPPVEMSKEQLMSTMSELENLINDIKLKMGDSSEDSEEDDTTVNINTGEGDDEVHVDQPKGSHDVESEEEYEDETGEDEDEEEKEDN